MSPKQKACLFPHLNLFFHLSPSGLCHKGQQNLARKEEKREKRKEKGGEGGKREEGRKTEELCQL